MKKICLNCDNAYWVNVHIDNECACPKCGVVDKEKIIGQREGRIGLADE
jgi:hypothetical protein